MKLTDILYASPSGQYFIMRATKWKGFAVYQNKITHSVCCARIGFEGDKGMQRAMAEIERREGQS